MEVATAVEVRTIAGYAVGTGLWHGRESGTEHHVLDAIVRPAPFRKVADRKTECVGRHRTVLAPFGDEPSISNGAADFFPTCGHRTR